MISVTWYFIEVVDAMDPCWAASFLLIIWSLTFRQQMFLALAGYDTVISQIAASHPLPSAAFWYRSTALTLHWLAGILGKHKERD